MENALDQVVKPHTGKAVEQSVIAPLPARLTPLEMGTPEGQRLHARIETARLAQRYAQSMTRPPPARFSSSAKEAPKTCLPA
jgi:hypothetical protein